MTHVTGHALAYACSFISRDIGRLVWGNFKHEKEIGITILCDVEGGQDLVPITLWDAHKLTVVEFAQKCTERVMKAKAKKDEGHNKSTAAMNFLPSFLGQPLLLILSYINVNLGIPLPCLGLRKGTMGHFVLTNIGTMGMQ